MLHARASRKLQKGCSNSINPTILQRHVIQRDEEETEDSQGEENENWEPTLMEIQEEEELNVDFHVT